ncbi:MAG: hypothetical protein HC782_04600 [Gammaproteobacteria bacterium]|nr:hypothetical protein [Gammaproteobacteria bacterium]
MNRKSILLITGIVLTAILVFLAAGYFYLIKHDSPLLVNDALAVLPVKQTEIVKVNPTVSSDSFSEAIVVTKKVNLVESISGANVWLAMQQASDLKQFRDALLASTHIAKKDRLYYAAAIDEACYATALRLNWTKEPSKYFVLQPRAIPLLSNEPNSDPTGARATAIAKLQSENYDKACQSYKYAVPSRQNIIDNWTLAAKEGDARSAAMLSDLRLRETLVLLPDFQGVNIPNNMSQQQMSVPPDPSSEHTRLLQAALSTGDPSAILTLGPTLVQRYENGGYVFGERREVISDGLRETLWPLLACEFGYDCGANNTTLLRLCAVRGICDTPTLDEYYRGSRLSPADIEQYDRLRPLFLNAIRSGDWSFMSYVIPRPQGSRNVLLPLRQPSNLGRG